MQLRSATAFANEKKINLSHNFSLSSIHHKEVLVSDGPIEIFWKKIIGVYYIAEQIKVINMGIFVVMNKI